MTPEQNSHLVPLSAYRDTLAGNQLMPWYPAQKQVRPYTPETSRIVSLLNEPGTNRYARVLPLFYSKNQIQPVIPESAYNSSRRLEMPKMNQVGLLIDIYA